MSLESALDDERREILKLLEGPAAQRPSRPSLGPDGRTISPLGTRSPVRSMLDVSISHGASTARAPIRSMLDPASPPPSRPTHSVNTSPTASLESQRESTLHRSRSDAAAHPPAAGPRPLRDRDRLTSELRPRLSPNSDYQFGMLPASQAHALPKRVSQGGRLPSMLPGSKTSVAGGGPSARGGDRGRNSIPGASARPHVASKSPSSAFDRSRSPNSRLTSDPGKFVTPGGNIVDMSSAYRRLSDAYLARSGGSLSALPGRQDPNHPRSGSGETLSPSGGLRLQKDYYGTGHGDEAVVESSEDSYASSDDDMASEGRRGRGRSRRKGDGRVEGWDENERQGGSGAESMLGMGRAKGPRASLSLLAAADEERKQVSSSYKVQSLLGPPPLTVTKADGERAPRRTGVHPLTSFDQGVSGQTTPIASDTEADISDIKRAQKMNVNISPIGSTPESNRVIRTVLRGDFALMQQEAEEGTRRQRTYLVATDLSDEAAHALEWTIGTVLRDGDTLLAIYAINEESGTSKGGDGDSVHGVGVGEGSMSVKDQAAAVGSLPARTLHAPAQGHVPAPSPLSGPALVAGVSSVSASPDSRQRTKAEQERFHVAEDISQRCVKLLRKTRLQVRVVIEVIHCKSPKHLITEVIDFIDPTLVILGSRGRSALKGVLLGSFSNYLVTKSSVPVMVTRKRLRKHKGKIKPAKVAMSNNLMPSTKGLASAKVDELTRRGA
ncbi:MAG: hypothetical protein M1832_001116 [Thelocarpon impressellum]|nr:MAG: hypothetical protein M1832_001116 [Thelocarpon impressellum]